MLAPKTFRAVLLAALVNSAVLASPVAANEEPDSGDRQQGAPRLEAAFAAEELATPVPRDPLAPFFAPFRPILEGPNVPRTSTLDARQATATTARIMLLGLLGKTAAGNALSLPGS